MIGEIIAIGDELTSGRINNTTSGYIARQLFAQGHQVRAMHTIGDAPELIGTTLKTALDRADFIIVTGGLGATTDDRTNEAVVRALDLKTRVHPCVQASIEARQRRNIGRDTVPLAKLALLPEGAEVLDKDCRMAGYLLRYEGKPVFFLPGVPPQMELLLHSRVLPALETFTATPLVPTHRQIYRTCGLQEIEINQRLLPLEGKKDVQVGYYPVGCEVHVTLSLPARDARLSEYDSFIRQALGFYLFGIGDETLAFSTGRLLEDQRLMLCVAESCTGGLIGSMITQTPGSSRWFAGGVIAYANTVKQHLLGVDEAILTEFGAVSAQTARAMAIGAATRLQGDVAVAATGIAGPDGGGTDKPVGTVFLGLFYQGRVMDRLFHFSGSRRHIQELTAYTALDLVRRTVLES
ncbi:CinA family nicotinamide mononucleotide deamidase-related protein [Desulfobulbus alkaliphilus]|uniref:CinA family nicotinamide mononucleotide deamidase-related protein n=1 Tax=Desulfobulbus alkaliphilus TaxID=869814 RepID=UPI001965DDDC|nr:CinA family nicotinamide mononucleotide deamidase-related protein [Desulfobulbus alkaliphilus]MBM9538331.1 CinA family nicotinamide mononucleotide deamidase-related protein [Desulfobulbus alkaliphilus]